MFAAGKTKGASAAAAATYIEDVFSTWLYTGNGSTQTITNGIDLAGKGGLVWIKSRSQGANYFDNVFYDTARGVQNALASSGPLATAGTQNNSGGFTGVDLYQFTNSGFSLGTDATFYKNTSADPLYASWTFREQPKFFDVVTYTGDGSSSGKVINHNLGSIPGAVIIKRTDSTSDWWAQVRRSDGQYAYGLRLNSTAAQQGLYTPTSGQLSSTQFSNFIADDPLATNTNGATYVAYLFAHNAGGFGLTGTDNVISCGSFTTDGSGNATVNLGYEPQWMINKAANNPQNWIITDNMRGWFASSSPNLLLANTSDAEFAATNLRLTSTGFSVTGYAANQTSIYIAIRRGPMKTPTSGTSVFAPAFNQSATGILAYLGQPTDFWIRNDRTGSDHNVRSRMTGGGYLLSNSTAAEGTQALNWWDNQVGVGVAGTSYGANSNIINYLFRRAPGFFDEVCYTVSGSSPINHNLGVAPELVIYKTRGSVDSWYVCANTNGFGELNSSGAWAGLGNGNGLTNIAQVTSTTISNSQGFFYSSGQTIVAYLFASCPGVSKVGSYTGNGSTQTINCGFTGGARFVLIKRTDSTGSWYVYDTARGMTTLTDPYLLLNSTAAESATLGSVTTVSSGFAVDASILAAINTNAASYIFLAIA